MCLCDRYHWRVAVIRSTVGSRLLISETCGTRKLRVDPTWEQLFAENSQLTERDGNQAGRKLLSSGQKDNGRDRDRTDDLYRVKVVPALYPHGSSLSWPTKSNQKSPHSAAIGQKLGSRQA
jgi:hypothetical protein